ncbi:MAG: DMT family transporter [Candidatus Nealsonbacteria bacterium]|nr:DMT family transporter [Candidatus Nealsonbacteria bacterium]
MKTEKNSSHNVLVGGLLVVAAMVIFGSYGLLVRFIQADAILLVWALQIVGVFCFSLYLLKNRVLFKHYNMLGHIFLMTIFVTVADLSFFMALRLTTVSTAVFVKFLMPIIVVVFTFRSSTVTIKKLLLLISLGTVGLFFVLLSQGNFSLVANAGTLWALVTAFTLALFIVLFKKIANVMPLPTILFYRYAIASIILLPLIFYANDIIYQVNESWPWLLGFGLLYAVAGTLIHTQGLKLTKVQYGAILGYIEPLAATVMSIVFLGEALTFPLLLGGILIFLGSALALK